jgi:glycosyltransferase involved in cell wall biosynthesis
MCERAFPKIVKNFVVVSDFLYKKSFANGATNVIKIINGINPLTASSDSAYVANKLLISSDCKYVFVLGNTFMRERASQLLRFIDFTASIDDKYVFITNAKIDVLTSESLNYDNYNLKYKSSLISVGHIPPEQLAFYFKKTSFSLFLAGDYDAERANYPIRIGTYISGGNPLVMNDINSEANNTVKKNNLGILNCDLFSLASEMVKLGNDEQRYNDICFNLKRTTNFLSWDSLAADLITYYKNIIIKSA